ncbi:alpha-2-macroglobulin family protein [Oleisolibacter albus]|uniref:alpha-2-macroglobulin family protein n=1 Tax=Oleisolibacter albus TaxID=2171757 RepID=UPI000DF23B75|nr:alpha-2-macroglobulin [Oleisolibacter albus]
MSRPSAVALLLTLGLIQAGPAAVPAAAQGPSGPTPPAAGTSGQTPAQGAPAQGAPAQTGPGQPAPEAEPVPRPFELDKVEVAAERDRPQVCFAFTRELPRPGRRGPDFARFVTVEPAQEVSVTVRDKELCLEGLQHGQTYGITLAAGLPAVGQEKLAEAVTRTVKVPDRRPTLAFRGQGYILPRVGGEGLPLRSVNVDRARLSVLRVKDRALVEQIYYGRINQTMTDFEVGEILEKNGEVVWRGEMAIGGEHNRSQLTAFPIDAVLGSLTPGVYVAVAENAALPMVAWDRRATQWFVVSDLGLTSFRAEDGLTVFARTLSSAKPQPGVELRLVARGNAELGRATTGADGLARFPADLLQGRDARAPQALFAVGPDGGFSLLDFGAPAVELAGRNAGGRGAVGPFDAYLFADRGAYRPGEILHLTTLVRDADAKAVTGQRLLFKLVRPDGLEIARRLGDDRGAGGYAVEFELPANAAAGRWTLTAHADPNGPALGRTEISVGEVAPPRVEVSLTADRPRIGADGKAALRLDGRYLTGGAAARLPGEMTLTLRPAATPFPGLEGYQFGLVQQPFTPEKRPLPGFTTAADGSARIAVDLGTLPATNRPLEAVLQATLHDVGGRSVEKEIVLPVDARAFALGVKPGFSGDGVPEGATVGFEVVAAAPDGQKLAKAGLSWELYEEEYVYEWFEADGRWDYRSSVRDKRLTGGGVDVAAGGSGSIEVQVKAGRYRLEVFDPASGTATSVRFSAGWWASAKLGDTPDTVDVVVEGPQRQPGGTARVFVRPPYDATVMVALADRRMRQTLVQTVPAAGAFLDLPLPEDLTGGAYVLVSAYAPADPQRRSLPRRAVGVSWVAVDPAARLLDVKMEVPAETRPRGTLALPVSISGLPEGAQAHLVVTAVDQALPGGRDGASPDPAAWFFGKRRLTTEMRDVYGRLLDPAAMAADPADAIRPAPRPAGTPPSGSSPVSVYSGIVTVGADGRAEVPLALPDMQGRLRLTAVAWSDSKLGRAEAALTVRDPVVGDVTLPAFLAPEDHAQIGVSLTNVAGPRGTYTATLTAEGPLKVEGGPAEFKALAQDRTVSANRTLVATGAGQGRLTLTVTGPGGYTLSRDLPVMVRPGLPVAANHGRGTLAPGATLALPSGLESGLKPDDSRTAVLAGPLPLFDVPALLLATDGRAFGSAEQLAGRLLPLLYVNDWNRELGLPADAALKERVVDLVERLSARQRGDGAFALWSADGPGDPWVTAFVLDVLTRAREAGYVVPEEGYRRGLDWLTRTIGNSWVDDSELTARAYAIYTAARARAIDAAPVRFFQETFLPKLTDRLARAQIAAAFALLGDNDRAGQIFGALDQPGPAAGNEGQDFGTTLRDRAATLALMVAGGVDTGRLVAEAEAVNGLVQDPTRVSTQERAWLLVAADALGARAGGFSLTVDGGSQTFNRPLLRRIDPAKPPVLVNSSDRPMQTLVSAVGAPKAAPEPLASGLSLTRSLLDAKGKPVDPAKVPQGEMLVVVLEGKAEVPPRGPLLVTDMLPAGFVIENVRLAGSAQLGDLSWLGPLSDAQQVEFRDDRFLAALDLPADSSSFRLVYLARAVTPGRFALPAARVEDMVDPGHLARTAAGTLTVLAPKR